MWWGEFVRVLKIIPAMESVLIAGLLVLWVREFFRPRHPFFKKEFWDRLPTLSRSEKGVLLLFLFFLLFRSGTYSVGQYLTWRSGPPGIYFLPPHQPMSYFVGYVWQRFGKESATTLFLAGAVFLLVKIANLLTRDRLFYDEEPYFAAIAILAAGWPGSVVVLAGVLLLGALLQLFFFFLWILRRRSIGRLALIYFWLPLALLSIHFGAIMGAWVGLSQFKI